MITELPAKQREALYMAAHGPLSMVRGYGPQIKALAKKGLLNNDLELTDEGREMYDELTKSRDWAFGGTYHPVSGVTHFGTLSADGATLYVTRHAGREPAQAYKRSTVPHAALIALGAVSPLEVVR